MPGTTQTRSCIGLVFLNRSIFNTEIARTRIKGVHTSHQLSGGHLALVFEGHEATYDNDPVAFYRAEARLVMEAPHEADNTGSWQRCSRDAWREVTSGIPRTLIVLPSSTFTTYVLRGDQRSHTLFEVTLTVTSPQGGKCRLSITEKPLTEQAARSIPEATKLLQNASSHQGSESTRQAWRIFDDMVKSDLRDL